MSEFELDFCDVLIKPKFSSLSSRSEVNLVSKIKFAHSGQQRTVVPIIAANLSTVGTMHIAAELQKKRCMTALHKHYSVDELVEFFGKHSNLYHTFYTMGISEDDLRKLDEVQTKLGSEISNVCIDVANGYMDKFYSFLDKFRKQYPKTVLMAGNVVSKEAVERLDDTGVDIAKVGIGSGALCITRRVAGVGRPQLSAVMDCVENAKISICSDGGCTSSGDVSKAFCAGADFVMLGSMLAGHTDPGTSLTLEGQVQIYGMSSAEAMTKYSGGMSPYRASEGRSVVIDPRGPISDTIDGIFGGIHSAGTYIGAGHLKDFHVNSDFYKVNRQLNTHFEK